MNAWLAGLFVTSAWLSLSYLGIRRLDEWRGAKLGLLLYALGTFCWSLKGIEIGDSGLIFISALQTVAVLLGVLLL